MPKIRTKRSLAKRVRITGTGKLKRCHAFSGCKHILEKKSPKRKRKFRKSVIVNKSDAKRIKKLVPYI